MRWWTVSATAVRAWQRLRDRGAETYEAAEAELLAECRSVRERYERNRGLEPEPRLGHPDLYVYRGGRPLRLRIVVDAEAGQVVDVLSIDGDGVDHRADTPSKQRRRARRAAQRK